MENCIEAVNKTDLAKLYSDLTENLLDFGAFRHLIFYHKTEVKEVEIIRILPEPLDIENRIKEKYVFIISKIIKC